MGLDEQIKEWELALKRANKAVMFATIAVGMATVSALIQLWNVLHK